MTPETILRLRRLATAGTPRVTIPVSTLTALLDAVAPLPTDLREQLQASAAVALPDAIAQRDEAISQMQDAQAVVLALADYLATKKAEIVGGRTEQEVREIFGAPAA